MHTKSVHIHDTGITDRSPVVFLHGFPDSPALFAAYVTEAERGRPWLVGRDLYAVAFPNRHEYLDFPFPVLYLRTKLDRIASTAAFERRLKERPDCRLVDYPEFNHWFPEQHADVVLEEIRAFLG